MYGFNSYLTLIYEPNEILCICLILSKQIPINGCDFSQCVLAALHVASVQGNPELADFLLKHEAVVNATDYHGHAPLHVACQKGQQALSVRQAFN